MPDTFFSLFVGYTLWWLIISFFLWRVSSRQAELAAKLDSLLSKDV